MQYCKSDGEGYCLLHGGVYNYPNASCQTTDVLLEVREERQRQFEMYGRNDDLEDGTGPLVEWLKPVSNLAAYEVERELRNEYNSHPKPTWMQLVREEVAEAFLEDSPTRLREELLQVAALCVSWVEKMDAR